MRFDRRPFSNRHVSVLTTLVASLAACTVSPPDPRETIGTRSDAIIGGTVLTAEESLAQHVVKIAFTLGSSPYGSCSGSVIAENAVLTAAHCVAASTGATITFESPTPGGAAITRTATQLVKHEFYNSNTFDADVGLVMFNGGLPFGYRPIALIDNRSDVPTVGQTPIVLAGYGYSSLAASDFGTRRSTTSLYRGRVGNANSFVSSFPGRSIAPGDSGGPAVVRSDGRHVQIGVNSNRPQDSTDTSIETDLRIYTPWIAAQGVVPTLVFWRANETSSTTLYQRIESETGGTNAHQTGRIDGDGWSAQTSDPEAFLVFGPYTTTVPAGQVSAYYRMLIDQVDADNLPVCEIDVVDATVQRVLARRTILRSEFPGAFSYREFELRFSNPGAHQLEFRTKYLRRAYVRQDRVDVRAAPVNDTFAMNHPTIYHEVGRPDGDGWSASTDLDSRPAFMSFGPYVTGLPAALHTATVNLMVDNTTYDDAEVAVLDVVDASVSRILSRRSIRRGDFGSPFAYTSFSIPFRPQPDSSIEIRTYWPRTSFVRQQNITIERGNNSTTFYTPGASHLTGHAEGTGWAGTPGTDSADFIMFGPYASRLSANYQTAFFRLRNNGTVGSGEVARIDVRDANLNVTLAERYVHRSEFSSTAYTEFAMPFLSFNPTAQLEYRTQYLGGQHVNVEGVRLAY